MPSVDTPEDALAAGPLLAPLDKLRPPRSNVMRTIIESIGRGEGFPSRDTLRRALGYSHESHIQEQLGNLCGEGYLYRWPKPHTIKRTWVYGVVIERNLIAERR